MQNTNQLAQPQKVNTAVKLLYATLGLGIINSVLFPPGLDEVSSFDSALNDSLFIFFTFGLTFGLTWLLIYMIGKGKNWARITYLVFFIMGALLSIVIFPLYLLLLSYTPVIDGSLFLVQTGMQLVALVFLFQGESSAWFKAIKQSKTENAQQSLQTD